MKLLKNVLIKLIRGGTVDLVMFIDNVPEDMFYRMAYPQTYSGKGLEQARVDDTSKEKIPTLHEELSLSQTGDGAIVFDMHNEQATARYAALRRYIRSITPPNVLPVEPVANSVDSSDSRATPLPVTSIPRAVLPVLSPPSGAQENPSKVASAAGTNAAALHLDVEAVKKQAVEEFLAAQVEEKKKPAKASKE